MARRRTTAPTGDPRYALGKFSAAVYLLSIGPGDVRSRLFKAFLELHPVTEQDLPGNLRRDYRWIHHQLTKREPLHDEGKLLATLKRMRNSTGVRLAKRIVDLKDRLEAYVAEQDRRRAT